MTDVTTLNGSIDNVVTSVVVVDGTVIFPGTMVKVDSEVMLVTNIVSNTLTVARGYTGTFPASHLSAAGVANIPYGTEDYKNTAQTQLDGGITSTQTVFNVVSGAVFPSSGRFRIVIESEILLVLEVAGATLTAMRGCEGTSAVSHATSVLVTLVLTQQGMVNNPGPMTTAGDFVTLDSAGNAARTTLALSAAASYGTLINKSGSYTLLPTDHTVNCTTGTFALTLPTAVGIQGKIFNLKNSGTGTITIDTTSAQTIDGSASGALTLAQWDVLTVQSDGANWVTL